MAIIRQEFEEKIKPDGYNEKVYPLTVDKAVYRKATDFPQVSLDNILSEGYRYGGVAVPNTTPSTIQRIFYLTSTEGTYTKFKDANNQPITVISGEGLVILSYDGQYWVKSALPNLGGGGGSSAQPFTISYDGNVIFTYNPTAASQDFDFKTLLDGASVGSLSTPRNIFNIPFDGTQDVQGDNTSGKIPLIRAGLFTDQIYPLFYTRELGGCGRAIPNNIKNYFPTGIVCNTYTWWGGFYSRKICKNLDNNLWSFEKGYCGVGSSIEDGPLTGIIDIRIPNTSYAKYTITISNVYNTIENLATIDVETYMDSDSALQKWVYKQTAIRDYDVRIAKVGDVHHILIGDASIQYAYYNVVIKAELNPTVTGSALNQQVPDKIERYIDSVFDYVTMNIITSDSVYTDNFIDPAKFTNYVKTEGNSTINGNIYLEGRLRTGAVTPRSGGINIGDTNNLFNRLHVTNVYESPNFGMQHFSKYFRFPAVTGDNVNYGIGAIKIPTVPYGCYDIRVAAYGQGVKRLERYNVTVAFNGAIASGNVITTQGVALDWNSAFSDGTDKLGLRLAIDSQGQAYLLVGEENTPWQTAFVFMECIATPINNLNVLGLSGIYDLTLVDDETIFTDIVTLVSPGSTPTPPADTYVFNFGGMSTTHTVNLPSTSGTTAKINVTSTKNTLAQAFSVDSSTFSNGGCNVEADYSGVTITYNANSGSSSITGQIILKQADSLDTITINVVQAGNAPTPTPTYAFSFPNGNTESLPNTSGTKTVTVTSTKTLSGTTTQQGFTILTNTFTNGTAIVSGGNLVITYNANATTSTKEGIITLKQDDSNTQIQLAIEQAGSSYVFKFTGNDSSSLTAQIASSPASNLIVAITSTKNGNPQQFTIQSNNFSNMNGSATIDTTNYDSITIPYKKNSTSSQITGDIVLKQTGGTTITLSIEQAAGSGPTPPEVTPTLQIESASLSGNNLTINLKTNPVDATAEAAASSDISSGNVKLLYWGHNMTEENALEVISSNWTGSWYTYVVPINTGSIDTQNGIYLKLAGNFITPTDYYFDHNAFVVS